MQLENRYVSTRIIDQAFDNQCRRHVPAHERNRNTAVKYTPNFSSVSHGQGRLAWTVALRRGSWCIGAIMDFEWELRSRYANLPFALGPWTLRTLSLNHQARRMHIRFDGLEDITALS